VGWALWLSIPVVVTALAAVWSWVRSRPAPVPTTHQAMREHSEYLDALVQTARSKDCGLAPPSDPTPGRAGDTTDPQLSGDS
jgi:hypothetical protein